MFPVINLNQAPLEILEPIGTKEKFWTTIPGKGRCLCKLPRPGTGEDWSEVIASKIAERIGLPHAEYFFGELHGQSAVVTPSFADAPALSLILGNTLLAHVNQLYNVGSIRYRQSTHTIQLVMDFLGNQGIQLPAGCMVTDVIQTAADVFVGYLVLDALIGNTDRHHENWGLVFGWETGQPIIRLAPTFDHASSLGCHEPDAKKEARLVSKDTNFCCDAYANRAKSAFFLNPADKQPLRTRAAFQEAARVGNRASASYWRERAVTISREEFDILLSEVPPSRMSDVSRRFALEFLMSNHRALSGIQL